MKAIRVGDRVIVREPGQPVRRGTVTNRETLDHHMVVDVTCDDGTRILACHEDLVTRLN